MTIPLTTAQAEVLLSVFLKQNVAIEPKVRAVQLKPNGKAKRKAGKSKRKYTKKSKFWEKKA
jgi:hypothetical protein